MATETTLKVTRVSITPVCVEIVISDNVDRAQASVWIEAKLPIQGILPETRYEVILLKILRSLQKPINAEIEALAGPLRPNYVKLPEVEQALVGLHSALRD